MSIAIVAAARPNFMKVKPVLDALEARGADTTLVHTGQHYDPEMSDVFFSDLGMRRPDVSLGTGSGTHAVQTAAVMLAIEPVLSASKPDALVVVGDVNSTLASALVAAKLGIRIAHVEAGLRSRDRSMPEEINRVVTDQLSTWLFAPSQDAADNLLGEGHAESSIEIVGNTMIDTLLANEARARARCAWSRFGYEPGGYGLATLHRPSNVDDTVVLARILDALTEVSREVPLLLPAHPRAAERLRLGLAGAPRVKVVEPLGYLDMISLMCEAALVLTDSGGVQEETTVLGIPCLTLRDSTERPVTVTEGTNQLVGTDRERIVAAASHTLRHRVEPRRPALWDGHAAQRIARRLLADA